MSVRKTQTVGIHLSLPEMTADSPRSLWADTSLPFLRIVDLPFPQVWWAVVSVRNQQSLRGFARGLRPRPSGINGGTLKKSDREIMEILEAFDTTGSAHSAAALAGVDPKTVAPLRRPTRCRCSGR